LWQAIGQSVTFTATKASVCPYDSRPAVDAEGVCDNPNSEAGHDGCPDNYINTQDLLALLGQIATTVASEGDEFTGYPIDAYPSPGCYTVAGEQVCYEDFGDGFVNVHDLLGLLANYGRDYVAQWC